MAEVGQDYYFHPSESPQGRKTEFFGKEVFGDTPEDSQTSRVEKDDDNDIETMEDMESFLVASKSEFSYLKLGDEDKDWSDKLLNSKVETFQFNKLGGMGMKPSLIHGDTIHKNNLLRDGLLSSKGPGYFTSFLL